MGTGVVGQLLACSAQSASWASAMESSWMPELAVDGLPKEPSASGCPCRIYKPSIPQIACRLASCKAGLLCLLYYALAPCAHSSASCLLLFWVSKCQCCQIFFFKKKIIASVYFMCAFIHLSEDKFQESVAGIELRSPGLVAGYLYLLSHLSSLMLEVL